MKIRLSCGKEYVKQQKGSGNLCAREAQQEQPAQQQTEKGSVNK
jgi:hypothetical protein